MGMKSMDVRKVIGARYVHGDFEEGTPELAAKFRKLAEINEKLFDKIPYEVRFTEEDHYSSAKEMRRKVTETGVIYIYSGGCDHDYFTPEENMKGRAVHDVFAHMVCGCPFSFHGELNAYFEQRKHYPRELWPALFAEIPMQTAAFYYTGGFDFKQRGIEAPADIMDMCEPMKKDYSHNSVLPSKKLIS